ncbi:phage portal protein [Chitinilyticum aquatile]|uniref:phage portal protein n=1 Tax=Chitinilyticum aquatile TaxID=362520 RepID=UPI0004066EEE|nr:phage portal protein [Chitinilyticum aquatile]
MNWLKRLFTGSRAEGTSLGLPKRMPGPAVRAFNAAQSSRLTQSLPTTPTHINDDLKRGLRQLRARARDLARNNDYARQFVRMAVRNLVGPDGFGLQVQCKKPDGSIDTVDARTIQDAFWQWAKPGSCDVTGKLSFVTLTRLLVQTLATDGEVLIRRVQGRGRFGYQLQLLDASLLDEQYNSGPLDVPRIVMGVELDEWEAPVAYHLKQPGRNGVERKRIPADEIFHLFVPHEIGQVRGVPWTTTGMLRLGMLAGYEEAAVIAARVGASKMGFFVPPEQDNGGSALETSSYTADPTVTDAEPGAFEVLGAGWDFKSFDPDYPHANYGSFVKTCLRGLSAGMGVSYNTLASDLEGVNYSSIRAGLIDERDEWMTLQSWLIESFLAPLYSEWLPLAIVSGRLSLPMAKLAKFDAARWQGRRWQWVDPEKDVNASVLAIQNGLSTWSDVLIQQGVDPEELKQRLQRDIAEFGPLIKEMQAISGGATGDGGGGDSLKAMADTYGVLVRAGAVTPQASDEDFMRSATGLPQASPEVQDAWADVGGVRRPITLAEAKAAPATDQSTGGGNAETNP